MRINIILALLLVFLCGSAWAQPTPSAPPSPESLGIQAPQPTYSIPTPPVAESNQALVTTTQASASGAAPSMTSSKMTSAYMIVPPEISAPNLFYIPYYPSTVASCYSGQWVPMWLDVKGYGPLYTYEWYPNGKLVSKYPANIAYPSWQKMWFYGDAPGWHMLQYYCNGWSNYIYVYVYGGIAPPQTSSYPYWYNYPYYWDYYPYYWDYPPDGHPPHDHPPHDHPPHDGHPPDGGYPPAGGGGGGYPVDGAYPPGDQVPIPYQPDSHPPDGQFPIDAYPLDSGNPNQGELDGRQGDNADGGYPPVSSGGGGYPVDGAYPPGDQVPIPYQPDSHPPDGQFPIDAYPLDGGNPNQGELDGHQGDNAGDSLGFNPYPGPNAPPAIWDDHQHGDNHQYENSGLSLWDHTFSNAIGLSMNNPQG